MRHGYHLWGSTQHHSAQPYEGHPGEAKSSIFVTDREPKESHWTKLKKGHGPEGLLLFTSWRSGFGVPDLISLWWDAASDTHPLTVPCLFQSYSRKHSSFTQAVFIFLANTSYLFPYTFFLGIFAQISSPVFTGTCIFSYQGVSSLICSFFI